MHFLWKKLCVVRAVTKYSFIWALSGANLQTYGLRVCHACSYISILKHSCRIILSHKGLEWLCMLFLTILSDNLFFYLLKYLTFPHCMLCYLQFIHGTPSLFLVLFCAFVEADARTNIAVLRTTLKTIYQLLTDHDRLNIGVSIFLLFILKCVNSIKNTVVYCPFSVSKNFEFLMIILLINIISIILMIWWFSW